MSITVPSQPSSSALDPQWAWSPYVPDQSRPWTLRWAGHLYRRTACGVRWSELKEALAGGPQKSIDGLLTEPEDAGQFNATYDDYDEAASGSIESLRAWWLRRIIETPYPLQEKMTLFWHSHLGISNARVKSGQLMARHVRMLRGHALGNYRDILSAALQDPAVFLGLDAAENRKARLKEHFARQWLDRYGVGPGRYSGKDVRDTARAFTGWFVLRNRLRYFEREFDSGSKSILGQQGNWSIEDVVRIVLEQRATALAVVRAIYRLLISETDEPGEKLLKPIVDSFFRDYDIGRLVQTMLRSNLFFSASAYRQRIKSPVEYAVGIVRGLEANVPTLRLGADLAALGQNLYQPPTVKGWAGGRHWINAATLLGRNNLVASLLAESGPYENKLDPHALAERYEQDGEEPGMQFLQDLLLQGDLDAGTIAEEHSPSADGPPAKRLRRIAYGLVTSPAYQIG